MSDEPEVTDQVPDDETPPEESTPNREAARYRTQLRESQAETEALRGQVRAMQRAELERVATSGDGIRLHRASDIWPDDAGTDLSELLDEDGRIDADAVRGVIEAATADRPYLRADIKVRRSDPSQGAGANVMDPPASWANVLQAGT